MCSSNALFGENNWWIILIIILIWVCCGEGTRGGADGCCGNCCCCRRSIRRRARNRPGRRHGGRLRRLPRCAEKFFREISKSLLPNGEKCGIIYERCP